MIGNEDKEDDWEVKEILDIRKNDKAGVTEFLLEWKDWDGEPSWEPEENCLCPDLMEKFKQTQRYKEKWRKIQSSTKQSTSLINDSNGFNRGAKLLKIVACDLDESNFLTYICKFDDRPEIMEGIPKTVIQERDPRATLRFLEKRLTLKKN